MKIAILIRDIPARYGGFETFAEKLAVGLSKRGFDVTVFCESGESSAPDSFEGVKLLISKTTEPVKYGKPPPPPSPRSRRPLP